VLLFAYFHEVYKSEWCKLVLSKKRFSAQIVETLVETAQPPPAPAGGARSCHVASTVMRTSARR
jgi:hypothetical protein